MLQLWDGTIEDAGGLAFVGEQARTLILSRSGAAGCTLGRLVGAASGRASVELAGVRIRLEF